jgi:hypothetical protein
MSESILLEIGNLYDFNFILIAAVNKVDCHIIRHAPIAPRHYRRSACRKRIIISSVSSGFVDAIRSRCVTSVSLSTILLLRWW